MKYERIEKRLFETNRERLVNLLPPFSLAIVQTNDKMPRNGDQFFPFRQNSDFFFLTGLEEERGLLMLCPNHPNEALRQILFIPQYSEIQQIWEGVKLSPSVAAEISGIDNVKYLDSFDLAMKEALEFADEVYLNSNEYPKFVTEVPSRDLRFANRLRESYPLHKYARLAPLLKELRLQKQEAELQLIRKACSITGEVFEHLLKTTLRGMYEYEVEAEIVAGFIRRRSTTAYAPIVASGKNACILHYTDNNAQLEEGSLLLLDFGAEYANYASDCSRTIPVSGTFSPRQKEVYKAVLDVFKAIKQKVRPGITINKLNEATARSMEEVLVKLGLLTEADIHNQNPESPLFKKYMMHGVSHFIGLDVHDPGTRDVALLKGMVLTCEPGIYIPEENIGVRIENTLLVGDKAIDLMEHIPIEAEDIEKLMQAV